MGNQEGKLLLIGLDNSGKTTILSRITNPSSGKQDITPTIGYRKQKFDRNGVTFEVFDMSGQSKYRDLWQSNANTDTNQIDGIIFVADASDKMRLNVARSQLQMILENQKIPSTIPYLFYANKIDIKGSYTIKQVSQILQLNNLKRQYRIFQSCGKTGAGVQAGIDWLSSNIKYRKDRKK